MGRPSKFSNLPGFKYCIRPQSKVGDPYFKAIARLYLRKTITERMHPLALKVTKNEARKVRRLVAELGELRISEMGPARIAEFLHQFNATPHEGNSLLLCLGRIYKMAKRFGQVKGNPVEEVAKLSVQPRSTEHISASALAAFITTASFHYLAREMARLTLLTGIAPRYLLPLQTTALLADGLHAATEAPSSALVAAWTPSLRAAVSNILGQPHRPLSSPYLFCIPAHRSHQGQPYTWASFSAIWERTIRTALKEGILQQAIRPEDLLVLRVKIPPADWLAEGIIKSIADIVMPYLK